MRTLLSFAGDSRGNIALLFALVLSLMLAAGGGAIDYARRSAAAADLQEAADAAALAAARNAGLSESERTAIARKHFAANNTIAGVATPAVAYSGGEVTVTVSHPLPTSLLRVIGVEHLDLNILSTAAAVGGEVNCVLLLDAANSGLALNSDSTLDAACGVQVNSSDSAALSANSNSHVDAAQVCIHGQAYTNSGSTVTPAPIENCPPRADPLAYLPEPAGASGPCDHTDLVINNGENATLNPGVYCTKLTVNSGGAATLSPGVYVFRDAEFLINSLADVEGAGVMLFFDGDSGRLNVNSGATLRISAPTSGTYKGVVFYQSRDPQTLASDFHIVNSQADTKLEGVVYAPNGQFLMNSSSGAANADAAWMIVIARRMELNSNGVLRVNNTFGGPTPVPDGLLSALSDTMGARLLR